MNRKTAAATEDEPYVVTSIRIKKNIRQRTKVYAAEHNTTVQEIIERALEAFLDRQK